MKRRKVKNQRVEDLWDNIRWPNLCMYIWHLTRRTENEVKKIFVVLMAENVPEFIKDINLHMQKAPQTPKELNTKKTTL